MNEFNAFARPVRGGYSAYLRTAKDGSAKPLLGKGGKPAVFGTELEAVKAALGRLINYINGHLVRDGEVATAVAAADSHFKPGVRQRQRYGKAKRSGQNGRAAY